jgi:hypothetical protein
MGIKPKSNNANSDRNFLIVQQAMAYLQIKPINQYQPSAIYTNSMTKQKPQNTCPPGSKQDCTISTAAGCACIDSNGNVTF